MKKIITFLALIFVALISFGQTASYGVKAGETFKKVNTDYTLTNAVAQSFDWDFSQHYPTTQDFIVNLDSLAGNHTNVAVALYGKKFDEQSSWTQIGSTINWKGTTADTTIVISNATANRYRLYRVTYTGTGTGTTTVDYQALKVYLE